MIVFTVHEQPNPPTDLLDRAARLVFIKDQFMWLAALFPAVWLLVKGMWLELLIYVAFVSMLAWGLTAMGATPTLSGIIFFIVHIVFGFEASALYRSSLERRGWQMVGTVTGRTSTECERRFFDTWLPAQPVVSEEQASTMNSERATSSWAQTGWAGAKDAMLRWRRVTGAGA